MAKTRKAGQVPGKRKTADQKGPFRKALSETKAKEKSARTQVREAKKKG